MSNQKIGRAIGIVLVAALLLGCVFSVGRVQRVEPEDPRAEETELLRAEALSTGRTGGFVASDDRTDETEPPEETTLPEETEPTREPEASDPTESSGTPDSTDEGEKKNDGDDTGGSNPQDSGDTHGGNAGDEDGDDQPEGPSIVTSLKDQTVTPADLQNGKLAFTARSVGGTGLSLEVRFRHKSDTGNGSLLHVNGRQDYAAPLQFGTNYITIYLRQNGQTIGTKSYSIQYRQSADADNPESGDHPPEIRMLSPEETKWPCETSNRNFTFTLEVTDTHTGGRLPASNIRVTATDSAGNVAAVTVHGYSYELFLERPNIGDTNVYTIEVAAWDEDGCSARWRQYTLTYQAIDSGDVIGSATIVIDATTVGMDILDRIENVEVRQDISAAKVVLDALEQYGYTVDYAGSVKIGFYIRALESGGINTQAIPEKLRTMVERDGIGEMDSGSTDRLSEFDYTRGSGWMYSINGSVYADKGLSERYLQDGDTLYLRFTLAYGKDIGGYGATGGGYGRFASYCYRYIGGNPDFLGHIDWEEVDLVEPTAESDGYVIRECVCCGEQETEILPALTPDPETEPTGETDPTTEPTEEPSTDPTTEPTEKPTTEPPTELATEPPKKDTDEEKQNPEEPDVS